MRSRVYNSNAASRNSIHMLPYSDGKSKHSMKHCGCIGITLALIIFTFILFALHYQLNVIMILRSMLSDKSDELVECLHNVNELDSMVNTLESERKSLQQSAHSRTESEKVIVHHSSRVKKHDSYYPYDLRDVMLLSNRQTDEDVMYTFMRKWEVQSPLYLRCGVVRSVSLPLSRPSSGAKCRVAIVSSYYPRPCGIATHSGKVVEGLQEVCPEGSVIDVIAVTNPEESTAKFPSVVTHTFAKESLQNHIETADYVNSRNYDMVIFSYEFGLYADEYFLCLLRGIKNTLIVSILHTLADNLPYQKQALLQQVIMLSHKVVVMTETMKRKLFQLHNTPSGLVTVIPHGVPSYSPTNELIRKSNSYPIKSIYGNNKVIFSNGLIHQGKGMEYTIEAMPSILASHPDALLVIQGTPHPTGDGTLEYYRMLQSLVAARHLENRVIFNDTFLRDEDLRDGLLSAHVYVNAYTDEVASVSGTLAMAMGFGVPCVSTPYPYASEVLADRRGILVPFRNPFALANAVTYLLDDIDRAREIGLRGAASTLSWNDVGKEFLAIVYE